jgi:hypothetical protein
MQSIHFYALRRFSDTIRPFLLFLGHYAALWYTMQSTLFLGHYAAPWYTMQSTFIDTMESIHYLRLFGPLYWVTVVIGTYGIFYDTRGLAA